MIYADSRQSGYVNCERDRRSICAGSRPQINRLHKKNVLLNLGRATPCTGGCPYSGARGTSAAANRSNRSATCFMCWKKSSSRMCSSGA